MKLTIFIFFVFISAWFGLYAHGQPAFPYTPLQDDEIQYRFFTEAVTAKYNNDIDSVTGGNKKYIIGLYKERYDDIKKKFEEKNIITSPLANNYLQSLLKEIVNYNPVLQGLQARVLFSRDYWPNAASMGEGTIIFNIGLFNRLQNESQACFALCHELAHLYLNHGNNAIAKYVNTVYSDEFQKKLKNIKNTQYQQREQLEGLVKTLQFNSRRHTREFESQADSMALELMKNTLYDVRESLACLALLDSVDNDKYDALLSLEKEFNFKDYPFQQSWIKQEQNLFTMMAKSSVQDQAKEKDSLKTHPDCAVRIQELTKRVDEYSTTKRNLNIISDSVFQQLKHIFDYEIIEYCYNSGNVSRSLYYTLEMLQFYPADVYLIANAGRCLNKMYEAQKNHVLGKIVDLPSPYINEKYNDFLSFLSKLRLSDIGAISYYFLLQYNDKFNGNREFSDQQKISTANFKSP